MSRPSKQSGFILKIAIPVVIVFVVVGILYWSSEQAESGNLKSEHKMSEGVAKFYATFRKSFMPGATQLDDYTIELPSAEKSVLEQLQMNAEVATPAIDDWTGEEKRRSFHENDTIKSALEKFATEEGVGFIWDLKYDYIVKNHFEESSDFKQLVHKVSRTVNNDYNGKVQTYFCTRERTMVVTADDIQYLNEFCQDTTSKRQKALEERMAEQYKTKKRLGLN